MCSVLAFGIVVENDATNVTTYFVLRDKTAGTVDTGVTITAIDLYYVADGDAISAKVDANSLTAADTAHTDNYAFHCGMGVYRIDWPDAAFDGGIGTRVQLIAVETGGGSFQEVMEVELSPPVNAVLVNDATPLSAANITDDVWSEAFTDPTTHPTGSEDMKSILEMLYTAWMGKVITNGTNSEIELYNIAGTKIAEAPYTDDGSLFTRQEWAADD